MSLNAGFALRRNGRLRIFGDNTIIIGRGKGYLVGRVSSELEAWADDLDQQDAEALLAAIMILRDAGPTLGRPLVDTIKGSRHATMKELRPGSTGRTEIRVLFAFDLERQAILLVGGDKSDDWTGWYKVNIPIADERFAEHQNKITQPRRKAIKGVPKRTEPREAGDENDHEGV